MVGVHEPTIHVFQIAYIYFIFFKLALNPCFFDLIATCVLFLFIYMQHMNALDQA